MKLDYIKCCDCVEGMRSLPDESVDLVITSPPYDNLRTYNGFTWDFEGVANELYRIVKQGGVVVWIVADATIDGSKTGTSFRQALYFKEIGFNIHDTMIWDKGSFTRTGTLQVRYASVFEYMFVFSKGKPKTFNPLKDRKKKNPFTKNTGNIRNPDGSMRPRSNPDYRSGEYGQRFNVWRIDSVKYNVEGVGHPAQFPESLVKDHIVSWSNKGDIVLDCFMGSGTTAIACMDTDRHYIGFEISQEYCDIAEKRIAQHTVNMCLW